MFVIFLFSLIPNIHIDRSPYFTNQSFTLLLCSESEQSESIWCRWITENWKNTNTNNKTFSINSRNLLSTASPREIASEIKFILSTWSNFYSFFRKSVASFSDFEMKDFIWKYFNQGGKIEALHWIKAKMKPKNPSSDLNKNFSIIPTSTLRILFR